MIVSAEGRVENQKLTQTAALLSFGWVFGFQLDSLENKCLIWREKPCKASMVELLVFNSIYYPSSAENRVCDRLVQVLVLNSITVPLIQSPPFKVNPFLAEIK